MDDKSRIGDRQDYTGYFALAKSDNFISHYFMPALINGEKISLKDIPIVCLDGVLGTYIGDGLFLVLEGKYTGDIFREEPVIVSHGTA